MRITAWPYNLGTLDAANEYTGMVFCKDFRNAIFTFVVANSANATLKFYTSQQDAQPTLASSASSTNQYSTTQTIPLEDHVPVEWDTGVVFGGSSDGVYQYEINTNAQQWIGIKMTARSAWDVTIYVSLYDNQ